MSQGKPVPEELISAGAVRRLAELWQATIRGDPQGLMSSNEDLPSATARGVAAGRDAHGSSPFPRLTKQLLQSVLEGDDSEEELLSLDVEKRHREEGEDNWGDWGDGGDEGGGGNGPSVVYFAHATLRKRGDIRLVVKMLSPASRISKGVDSSAMAQKEAGIFKHVLPNMASLWGDEAWEVFPKCYHASAEMIVMEDLRASGFAHAGDGECGSGDGGVAGLTPAQCAAAARALARFHAASLAYKGAGVAEAGAVLAEAGRETVFIPGRRPQLEERLRKAGDATLQLLRRHPLASKHEHAVEVLLRDRWERLAQLHRAREPMAVLTHGAPRAAHLLFRPLPAAAAPGEEQGDGEPPLEARLLDLRACRYGSPALDLAPLVWGAAAGDARTRVDQVLRAYYTALAKALKGTPGAPRPPFTLAELRRELEQYSEYALLTADLPPAAAAPFGDLVLELADKGLL